VSRPADERIADAIAYLDTEQRRWADVTEIAERDGSSLLVRCLSWRARNGLSRATCAGRSSRFLRATSKSIQGFPSGAEMPLSEGDRFGPWDCRTSLGQLALCHDGARITIWLYAIRSREDCASLMDRARLDWALPEPECLQLRAALLVLAADLPKTRAA
jgi:hypothetical protein